MKKIILLLVPVLFFTTVSASKGGNSKKMVHDTIRVMVHDTIRIPIHDKVIVTVHDTIRIHDTVETTKIIYRKKGKTVGPMSAPAQVWDNETLISIAGATIIAKDGALTVETVTSNAQGAYSFNTLANGKAYTFKCSKTGYTILTKTATFTGTNSLPEFALTK